MREILTVKITMNASAQYTYKYSWPIGNQTSALEHFSINNISINADSLYSLNGQDNNWQISNTQSIISEQITESGSINLFVLKNSNTTIDIQIDDKECTTYTSGTWGANPKKKTFSAINSTLSKSGCTYTSSHSGSTSTFVFTITDNATIEWSGTQT